MSKDTQPSKHTPGPENIFYWFPNHGDEDGNNSFTICYGDPTDDLDVIIVGTENSQEDATEACKRLNTIVESLLEENKELKDDVRRLTSDVAYWCGEFYKKHLTQGAENQRLRKALEKINENAPNAYIKEVATAALKPQE